MLNQLILGDNLEILRKMDSESVDLIYLDPPFFSNRNYEVIWGDAGEIRSFQDRWSGGIDHYIAWLKERVVEMFRILKPTGSIYLHCDWHADAYIRVYILDKIFGEQNLVSTIIWKRTSSHNDAKRKYGDLSDTIYVYSKTDKYTFNIQYVPYSEEYVEQHYSNIDEKGRRFKSTDSRSPNPRPNLVYDYKGYKPHSNGWAVSRERMEQLDNEGRLLFPKTKNGRIRFKHFLDEMPGMPVGNVWDDIKTIHAQSKERIGYPTQKPEKLLERIILASSNEGDVVLDPFVGGGTTVAVADRLGRAWIGIDQSVQAIKVSEMRLNKQQDLFSKPFVVQLHKYDYDDLRYKEAFAFEAWIVQQYGGTPNTKQRSDKGLDGKTREGVPIQVKRSDDVGRNVIDNFKAACERFDKALYDKNRQAGAPIGVIIAFSFGKGAVQEVARLRNEENLAIKLARVDEIVPVSKKPAITLDYKDMGTDAKGLRQIEFTAVGASTAGIEFYAWDWDYDESTSVFKPELLIDKTGVQQQAFKPGVYVIGVKAVDNDGLETLEVIRLKVNGGIREANAAEVAARQPKKK